MPSMTIGSIRCDAGRKARGYLEAVRRVDGTVLGIPVLIVCGRRDGPVLLVDGAIHGDEPEGTLAIQRVAREIDPGRLSGVFVGVPVMNVGAFEALARGNPRDTHTYDMNRIYPGKPRGFLTDRIAVRHHEDILKLADLEISIHSGGNISYLAETIFTKAGDTRSEELGRAMGADWPVLLETPHPLGSPMAAMVDMGKPAITVELGGAATCMPDALAHNVDVLSRAILNVCRHYGMLDGEATYAQAHWRGKQSVVQATASGLLEPTVFDKLKEPVARGETLLRTVDLFGDLVEELRAPCDGTVFGFRTYPSVTAGDWALFCADATLVPAAHP
jgi:predicted deacylase